MIPTAHFIPCLLLIFSTTVGSLKCNYIETVTAETTKPEMVGLEHCKNDSACVTQVQDGWLTMGCLDSVKHWRHISLCFRVPSRETACSYNQNTRMGFSRWGTGFCCCRSEVCNQLPPEWLALSRWRFRWRVFSNFLIVTTIFSLSYFIYGISEARNVKIQEKRFVNVVLKCSNVKKTKCSLFDEQRLYTIKMGILFHLF
ncbi:hypothetical protein RB195_013670 [Necator americanus]|uniref:Activin types I and II receptor domain protein n=1 Tax=Necator americanus TaxID=51031 RepID=A0ABR1DWR4_NECAM